jgi:general secretion pathway protein H
MRARGSAHARGFTLLELMVVIVLAGILLAVVSINVTPDPRQQLEREARRIGQLLAIAADESRITSQRLYWEADLRGYRFVADAGGERRLFPADDLLRGRTWERPLEELAVFENGATRPTQVILAAGAAPIRLPVAREWVQPRWRLELVSDSARVALDFDESGRGRVVAQ